MAEGFVQIKSARMPTKHFKDNVCPHLNEARQISNKDRSWGTGPAGRITGLPVNPDWFQVCWESHLCDIYQKTGCLVLFHTSVKGLWYLLWEGSPPRMGFNHSPLMKCSRWIGSTPRSRSPFIRPLSRVWSVTVHQKWNLSAGFSPNLTSVLQRLVNTSVFTPLTFCAYQTIM